MKYVFAAYHKKVPVSFRLLLLIFIFFAWGVAQGASPPWFKKLPLKCQKSLNGVFKRQRVTHEWQREVDPEVDQKSFVTPTRKLGHWLEVRTEAKGQWVTILVHKPRGTQIYSKGDFKKCVFRKTRWLSKNRRSLDFTDKDLNKIVDGTRGVIYTWSQGMIYSLQSLKPYEKVIRSLGLHFHAFQGGVGSKESIRDLDRVYAIKKEHRRKVASTALEMRGYRLHSPSCFVFSNGKIHRSRITGMMSPFRFEAEVRKRMSELDRESR